MTSARIPQVLAVTFLIILLIFTIVPIILLLFLSTKDNLDIIMNFWALPKSIKWENYTAAFAAVKDSIGHSLFICVVSVAGSLLLASLSGYVFARHTFPAKGLLFMLIMAVIAVPALLLIVPQYAVITKLHLTHTYWGLILTYIGGTQIFGILLCRTFFESLPEELFEAARIDGGNEFYLYRRIALPLSIPILITIAIVTFLGVYNDYLLPLIILDSSQTTFSLAAVNISSAGRQDVGLSFAAYVIGSIPLAILLAFGMKYYIQGSLTGAIKS
jgi:ABC-type glycerol-3-phosphate transport system permease component